MKKLNIRSYGKFGSSHSWSYTTRSLAYELYKMGHSLSIQSTDGYLYAQNDLSQFYNKPINPIDIDFCYTLPVNFKSWFNKDSRLKLGIFNWESSLMPKEWISAQNDVDFILPSSDSVRQVFLDSGWDNNKVITLPLGVDWNHFGSAEPINISGSNSFKFLNVSIPHYRKNIDIVVNAYYDAFSHNDDVSLFIKTDLSKPNYYFECYVPDLIKESQKKFFGKRLPKIHIIIEKYKDMAPLYKASDCLVSASSFEGFGLPMLESLAAGCQVIAPRCSGQMDFLNDDNSFLINCKKVKAEKKYQYWKEIPEAYTYLPKSDEISEKMLDVYSGKRKKSDENLKSKFSWENSANKIMSIYENFQSK